MTSQSRTDLFFSSSPPSCSSFSSSPDSPLIKIHIGVPHRQREDLATSTRWPLKRTDRDKPLEAGHFSRANPESEGWSSEEGTKNP